jgi:hypothetical protein
MTSKYDDRELMALGKLTETFDDLEKSMECLLTYFVRIYPEITAQVILDEFTLPRRLDLFATLIRETEIQGEPLFEIDGMIDRLKNGDPTDVNRTIPYEAEAFNIVQWVKERAHENA